MRVTIIPKVEKVTSTSKYKAYIDAAKVMTKDQTLSIQFEEKESTKDVDRLRYAMTNSGFKTFYDGAKKTLFVNHKPESK